LYLLLLKKAAAPDRHRNQNLVCNAPAESNANVNLDTVAEARKRSGIARTTHHSASECNHESGDTRF
jgi:hypothetical protein